jgi:DNA-binding response OmpR family regulator
VLVVEPEETLRELLLLAEGGYAADGARDEAAARPAARHAPALILRDEGLPERPATVARAAPRAPTIVLTRDAGAAGRTRDADALLPMPFAPEELLPRCAAIDLGHGDQRSRRRCRAAGGS